MVHVYYFILLTERRYLSLHHECCTLCLAWHQMKLNVQTWTLGDDCSLLCITLPLFCTEYMCGQWRKLLFADAKVTEVVAQWPCSHGQPLREAGMIAALFSVERMQELSSEMCGKRQRDGGRHSGVLVTSSSYMSHRILNIWQSCNRSMRPVSFWILTQSADWVCLTDVIVDANPPAFLETWWNLLTFLFCSNILWGSWPKLYWNNSMLAGFTGNGF